MPEVTSDTRSGTESVDTIDIAMLRTRRRQLDEEKKTLATALFEQQRNPSFIPDPLPVTTTHSLSMSLGSHAAGASVSYTSNATLAERKVIVEERLNAIDRELEGINSRIRELIDQNARARGNA